jgi:hypothetical protein
MVMEEATAAMVAAEEHVATTTALDAVAMARPDDSGGGCPDVVRSDTGGAPDMTLDLKATGKTHVATIGSGGSSPPPTSQALSPRSVVSHAFIADFSLFYSHSLSRFSNPCSYAVGRRTQM